MSCIYEHYYVNEYNQEISFYVGKSKNVVERLQQHITDSITDEHSKLYTFIRSIGGFEKVKTRILHDNLPEDSDNWIVCYFERLHYEEKAKNFDMMNSTPPLLAREHIDYEEVEKYKDFTVPRDALINSVLNAYKDQLVKVGKLNCANELFNKNKILGKEKSRLNEVNGMLKKSVVSLEEDKKFLTDSFNSAREKIKSLEKMVSDLNEKNDRCVSRMSDLSDKLIDTLSNQQNKSIAPICMPSIGNQIEISEDSVEESIGSNFRVETNNKAAVDKTQKYCEKCDNFFSASNFSRHKKLCNSQEGLLKKHLANIQPEYEKMKSENKSLKIELQKLRTINELFLKGDIVPNLK